MTNIFSERYRDLEREFHRRNEDSAHMRQEFQDLRLRLLEQEKELERAKTGTQESSKAPNPLDEGSWFSKEDRQTMEEFGELTSTFRKIVQHELAKNSQPQNETVAQAQQRLEQIEQVVQQQNHSQFLRSHESHMASEVGDDYRDIDRDPGFQSFVLASPALTKMMTESVDPVDHASVMNLWLDTTQEGKAYRPDPVPKASPQKKEARRRAASSLVKNSAPQITKNPDDMSLEELWDSIPEGDENNQLDRSLTWQNYGGTGSLSGSSYGDLSANDALTIQKKMLPIAKRLLTFGKFAQKETKPQKQGLEIRHRRYERFPIVDSPLAEGVTPDFVSLEHTTLMHTLKQYGSYVNTTDVMMAASHDPILSTIVERQSQQAGETLDFLAYKVFRAGTQVKYGTGSSSPARSVVNHTVGGVQPISGTAVNANATSKLFDTAIRKLESNDAKKMRNMLRASVGIDTSPIKESYIGICHPDLRQDLENLSDFIPVEKYSEAGQAIEGEIGTVKGVRIITTTQATPFADAGGSVAAEY